MKSEPKSNILEKMIANRETELQRAFDGYTSEKEEIEKWLKQYEREARKKAAHLNYIGDQIAKCYERAIQQGYPRCLD